MKTILIPGGAFAGSTAAVGAARELDALGITGSEAEVSLISREPFPCIRPGGIGFTDVLNPW
jgi:NADPH-dependent 2,4-dienoyl-CoA reductase/sulfur reductase-like enzyme